MNINYEKHINPENEIREEIDKFLNSGFFDCPIDNFNGKEIYYVARNKNEIIGARKVLFNFEQYYKQTKWRNRLNGLIRESKNTYYLQALAVSDKFQNKGIGSKLLDLAIKDISVHSDIFVSLCSTNTIQKKYSLIYNFRELRRADNRIILGRRV